MFLKPVGFALRDFTKGFHFEQNILQGWISIRNSHRNPNIVISTEGRNHITAITS